MKILLVGSGGREHALALGLQADPSCTELHCAPGNPGIAEIATLHSIAITDNSAIVELAKKLSVDLVVIGPEVPLVNGVADDLRAAGLAVFGPSKAAAQLEGSKNFAKGVMRDAAFQQRAVLPAKLKRKLKTRSMLSVHLMLLKTMVLLQAKELLSPTIAQRR